MQKFLSSNKVEYRLLRTILQGIIGILIANVDTLVGAHYTGSTKAVIVALVMAILSPLMGALATQGEEIKAYDAETANVRDDIEAKDLTTENAEFDDGGEEEEGGENE